MVVKLSIIIVSWNVAKQLEQCLASIFAIRSSALPLEVIVIDNASSDGTVEIVKSRFPDIVLIANAENRGFGAACNQGIQIAQGEYICFLNPDTEVNKNALQTLVDYLDSNRGTALVAPRITYPDGSMQRSIRRFPTPAALLAIFFKLDRVLPLFPALRNYFAKDFDYSRTQEVDQPMGACLMVRKATLDAVGVFDERFFIWFEEVDLCKRIQEAGYKIVYVADATILHHQAKSFKKQDLLTRQKNFYTSARAYLNKHYSHDVFARAVSELFCSYTAAASFLLSLRASTPKKGDDSLFDMRVFAVTFLAIGAAELFSLLVYADVIPALLAFGIISVSATILALWRLDVGAGILIAELIIGSKGYLFSIDSWDWRFPIRMALFSAVLLAWGIHFIRDTVVSIRAKKMFSWPSIIRSRFRWWHVALAAVIIYGFVTGTILGNPVKIIISDGNAWIFFLVAVSLYDAFQSRSSLQVLTALIAAALTAQTVKVFLTFYIMGHQGFTEVILTPWYHWIRNTGVGEITALPSMMTRVFFQSQIFALAGFVCLAAFALVYFIRQCDERKETMHTALMRGFTVHRSLLVFAGVLAASLIVSFSRSIWVAGIATGIAMIGWAIVNRVSRKALTGFFITLFASAAFGLLLLVIISSIPFPTTSGIFDFRSVQERVSDVDEEAAAASRWQLLPVLLTEIRHNPLSGYGFGKTVTYESSDPRVAQQGVSARYTTFAFEWGYLDIWIKLGFAGIAVYVAFLLTIIWYGLSLSHRLKAQKQFWESALSLGVSMGLFALAVTHIFTPYLNHPLGIGIVIIAAIIVERLGETKH
ncbi:glycosyltransferase [Candidatus Uhrbacteria bacterium]|nr:glycosyltransferase [Candidatus Uhrbacteria bacterium]